MRVFFWLLILIGQAAVVIHLDSHREDQQKIAELERKLAERQSETNRLIFLRDFEARRQKEEQELLAAAQTASTQVLEMAQYKKTNIQAARPIAKLQPKLNAKLYHPARLENEEDLKPFEMEFN